MDRRRFLRSSLLILTAAKPFSSRIFSDDSPARSMIGKEEIRDYLLRMKNFDAHYPDDIVIEKEKAPLLSSCVAKLRQVERTVGHGHFNALGFSRALAVARNYSPLPPFTPGEISFLEEIFYTDAAVYGFLGRKTTVRLDHEIPAGEIQKIAGSGGYLYRGRAVETFEKARRELGDDLIMTSGVRGVVKQMLLFLGKAHSNSGNLSLASRQLAPPGYSYHGVGDLDVGKRGFGAENFTERFMLTDVFRKLFERGYLSLRYPQDNLLGVRYEPWHIKIVDWV